MARQKKDRTDNNETGRSGKSTSNRGFASMDPERQRQIARKGGEAVSGNRQHMAEIGRKGGEASGGGRNNNNNNNNNNSGNNNDTSNSR
ncbi:MAG TPA: KGG domain-containing protein [Chitinophagaceae bacterium]|nr:KGG domain-containing protein [Chitinophagaceae bacterium]